MDWRTQKEMNNLPIRVTWVLKIGYYFRQRVSLKYKTIR